MLAQPCNVSRKEELQALVDKTLDKWGRIDIAVANAAVNPYYGPLTAIPDEAFDKVFLNNVKSVLWLAGMTLPDMAERGGGSFITVGSIGGIAVFLASDAAAFITGQIIVADGGVTIL